MTHNYKIEQDQFNAMVWIDSMVKENQFLTKQVRDLKDEAENIQQELDTAISIIKRLQSH